MMVNNSTVTEVNSEKYLPICSGLKLGLYIGQFNPIHIGHIQLLVDMSKYLDKIYILITYDCDVSTSLRESLIVNEINTYSLRNVYSLTVEGNYSISELLKQLDILFEGNNLNWILTEKTYLEIPKYNDYEYLEIFPKVLYSNNNYNDSSIITTVKPTNEFNVTSSDIRNMINNNIDPRPLIGGLEYDYIISSKMYMKQ